MTFTSDTCVRPSYTFSKHLRLVAVPIEERKGIAVLRAEYPHHDAREIVGEGFKVHTLVGERTQHRIPVRLHFIVEEHIVPLVPTALSPQDPAGPPIDDLVVKLRAVWECERGAHRSIAQRDRPPDKLIVLQHPHHDRFSAGIEADDPRGIDTGLSGYGLRLIPGVEIERPSLVPVIEAIFTRHPPGLIDKPFGALPLGFSFRLGGPAYQAHLVGGGFEGEQSREE